MGGKVCLRGKENLDAKQYIFPTGTLTNFSVYMQNLKTWFKKCMKKLSYGGCYLGAELQDLPVSFSLALGNLV